MMIFVTPVKTAAIAVACLLTACASGPGERGPRQSQLRDCPPGQVLICESRENPSKANEEEIPVYEFCYCENIM
jgi:hypothetical protein